MIKHCFWALVGLTLVGQCHHNTVVAEDVKAIAAKDLKWVSLFDGKTTKGWHPRGKVTRLEAVDGELRLLSKTNVWVTTDMKRANFVLEAEVKIPQGATGRFNSGLAFRCTGAKGKPKGYQCEIDGGNPGKDGGLYGIGLGGWLYPAKKTGQEYLSRIKPALKHGQWNRYRVHCEGPRIRIYVNGALITDVEHQGSLSGYFGIQHHGHGGEVRFRNLRVADLGEGK
jgi:hypothetical protein